MKPDIRPDTGYRKRTDLRPAGYPVQPYIIHRKIQTYIQYNYTKIQIEKLADDKTDTQFKEKN